MKIIILSMEYPPNIYGGVGVHVGNMASELSKLMNVEVRTKWFPRAPRQSHVRRYRVAPVLGDFGPAVEAFKLDLEMVADPMDCDIVHSHTWYMNMAGALARKLYDIPAVATVHSLEPLRPWKAEQLGRGYELSKWMEREGLCACDRVIAVSEGMKKDIMKCYPISSSKISVVYNGIDPAVYARREDGRVLRKFGVRAPYVLFFGRLTRQKGVFDLLEASKRFLPGTQLVLATGKPDEPGILDELAKDGKARIKKLAKKSGLPMSTVHHRIAKMEREGVIRKYSAIPDYRKIGLPVCAYILVNVDYSGIHSQEAVAKEIKKLPNVLEANIISGEIDIIAKVRASDIDELGQTVIAKMRNIKGVAKTVTSVVMKEIE